MKIRSFVTWHSEQGDRPYQEDYANVWCRSLRDTKTREYARVWSLAIYDGHGGSQTASLCANNLACYFWEEFDGLCAKNFRVNILNVLRKAFAQTDKKTRHLESGSTASVVIVHEKRMKAYVAILGDSPVVVFDRKKTMSVSPEHNVRVNSLERERACERGLVYEYGYLVNPVTGTRFGLSRGFGDAEFDSILLREPELYIVDLGPESFILVASDGVFDPGHYRTHIEARRLAQKVKDGWEAKDVSQDAIRRKTGDNATAIVWRANRACSKP